MISNDRLDDDEIERHFNSHQNSVKNYEIKYKKKNIHVDRQQLYSENLQLKAKIKDLLDINIKIKTQLSIAEKQKQNLFNIAQQEAFHQKIPRAASNKNHKQSTGQVLYNQVNANSPSKTYFSNEKQNMVFKKLLRDQRIEIEKLNNENQRIKKTMKFTRMSEIMTENKELLDETIRLKAKIAESKEVENHNYNQFAYQIENLRRKLNDQKQSEKRNEYDLKKQREVTIEMKQKLRQSQTKRVDLEKRLSKEIKALKNQNIEIKSRILQLSEIRATGSKQCQKQQCFRNKKEKIDLKKKIQVLEKQIKKLKESEMKKISYSAVLRNADNLKPSTYNKTQAQKPNIQVPKIVPNQQKVILESKIELKQKAVEKNKQSIVAEAKEEVKERIISDIPLNSEQVKLTEIKFEKANQIHQLNPIQLPKKEEAKKIDQKQQKTVDKPSPTQKPKEELSQIIKKQQEEYQEDYEDSMNTQKLLESVDPKYILQIQSQPLKVTQAKVEEYEQDEEFQKYKESDGEYEDILDDQEVIEVQIQKPSKKGEKNGKTEDIKEKVNENNKEVKKEVKKEDIKVNKKEVKENKQEDKKEENKVEKKEEKKENKQITAKEKKGEKDSQKSKEKTSKKGEAEEMSNKNEDKNEENDQSQLRLIKETLLYKFIAQRYTYDNFCSDMKNSGIDKLPIQQIMNLLSEQPFILSEQHVESIIIYLFETDNLSGEETMDQKTFIKKMKKFIGKAGEIDEELDNENIDKIKTIIEKDEEGGKVLRKKCQKGDNGDGTISRDTFTKIMGEFKVKDKVLQTALSQIAYVSSDLNHLNYDLFIRRFTQAEINDEQQI